MQQVCLLFIGLARIGEKMKNRKVFLSVAVGLLFVSVMACSASGFLPTTPTAVNGGAPIPGVPTAIPQAQQQPVAAPNLVNQQDALVSLYQSVSPGVVTILTGNALGSGWVYSSDGYIVTNQHVVAGSTKVEVDFVGGSKVYGNVVGSDANSDLAVVKVNVPADQLHPLTLANSDQLQVGDIAVAIGDPLALNGTTFTQGVIAGLGRSEESNAQSGNSGAFFSTGDFIETDALLNHGNSGGPLLNLSGQVIGVNRSIQIDPSTGIPSGLGYAISSNVVSRVVPELIKTGKFDYPYLGLSFFPDGLTLDMINALGLKSTYGAYITDVTPGGPGDKAGLKGATTPTSIQNLNSGGDLVIAVDGHKVLEFNDLMRYIIVNKAPGDTVTLTIERNGQDQDVQLTLGVRPH
jgi:S1-C subfamily serine protease